MNAVIGGGAAPAADWLLVSPGARRRRRWRFCAGRELMFYRHRAAVDDEPLSALVHQTAMYHEDRLGGTQFSRVWLCGGGAVADEARARHRRAAGRAGRAGGHPPGGDASRPARLAGRARRAGRAGRRAAARSEGGLAMLRGNLSTRPFYNERLVTLVLLLVAVGVGGADDLQRHASSWRCRRSAASSRRASSADRTEADRIAGETAKLRQTVDLVALRRLSADTPKPTRSSTSGRSRGRRSSASCRDAMPFDVRLQTVTPRIEKGQIHIRMVTFAKTGRRPLHFIAALQATKRFRDGYATEQQLQDDGTTWVATLQGQYLPVEPMPPSAPAKRPWTGEPAMSLWRRVFRERRASCCRSSLLTVASVAALALGVFR